MKKLLLFLAICFSIPVFAQKVSYKKWTISVNKKAQYKVDKTKKGGLVGLSNFALRTIQGEDILVIKDTAFYLEQLPNELKPRVSFWAYEVTSPDLKKTTIVPIIGALNFGKKLMKDLQGLNFFNEGSLTESIYDEYVNLQKAEDVPIKLSSIDTLNILRKENYDLTEKMFGPLLKRNPGSMSVRSMTIKEGTKSIGSLKLNKKGSYAHTYKVINNEGNVIGGFTIIQGEGRANVRLMVDEGNWDEKRKWFYHKDDVTLEQKFNELAIFLVNAGYL